MKYVLTNCVETQIDNKMKIVDFFLQLVHIILGNPKERYASIYV